MRKFYRLLLLSICLIGSVNVIAQVRVLAEIMPRFQGGEKGLKVWLSQNMKYPQESIENKEEGKVVISCIIDERGNITSPKVIKHVSERLNEEALRLVSNMPQWTPARQDGKPCAIYYSLPIIFKLPDNNNTNAIQLLENQSISDSVLSSNNQIKELKKSELSPIINNEFIHKIRQYDELKSFKGGLAAVYRNGKWGFVNIHGDEIIPCEYTEVESFSDGCAAVAQGDKYGFIDDKGNKFYPCRLSYEPFSIWGGMTSFHEGVAFIPLPANTWFRYGASEYQAPYKLFGGLNKSGEMVFSYKYADCRAFCEGRAPVKLTPNSNWGAIDTQGNLVIDFCWSELSFFVDGLARAKSSDGRHVFIDKYGNISFYCTYGRYDDCFSEGMCAVATQDWKWGYVDTHNKLVIPQMYEDAASFNEGVARICVDDKYGYINKRGEQIIPCQYDDMSNMCSEGLIAICKNGKWGYINIKGDEVIPCVYSYAKPFSCGLALVKKESVSGKSLWGYVDKNGNDTF